MNKRLSIPKYLTISSCQNNEVDFAWEEGKSLPELETPDQQLFTRLLGLSKRAVLAFAIGSAEWVVYRFDQRCDTSTPWQLIQTAWAMIVHLRYTSGPECWASYAQDSWGKDEIEGPINRALGLLEASFFPEYPTDPPQKASKIAKLTSHVLSDTAPYSQWCDKVLTRFEALYRRDPQDEVGVVVPRQAADPDYPFELPQTECLIQDFLASLDHRSNIFLSSPEEMLEELGDALPFPGTPYKFQIDQDVGWDATVP